MKHRIYGDFLFILRPVRLGSRTGKKRIRSQVWNVTKLGETRFSTCTLAIYIFSYGIMHLKLASLSYLLCLFLLAISLHTDMQLHRCNNAERITYCR